MTERDNHAVWDGRTRGLTEAWYLTFTDPASGQGFWIRAGLRAAGAPASGEVWFARLHPSEPERCVGLRRRSGVESVGLGADGFSLDVDGIGMSSGSTHGRLAGDGHEVSWNLAFPSDRPTVRLLSASVERSRLLPRVQLSGPDTRVSGRIEVDGEVLEVRDASGQQGHVVGRRLPDRWAWAHAAFDPDEATLDLLTARTRLAGVRVPYVTAAVVRWQGQEVRLRGLGREPAFGLGTWRVDLGGRRFRLTGRVEAPAHAILRADLEDADGSLRFCHGSTIASSRLALFERHAGGFEQVALLESRGTTHAAWAGRTPAPQVERAFVGAR